MAAPYSLVNDALNAARIRLNDVVPTLQAVSGKLLDNTQAGTQVTVNLAWQHCQEYLRSQQFSKLDNEINFLAVPGVTNLDPLAQCYIDWTGYFDGSVLQPAPVLPQDFIVPYTLWERLNGVTLNMTEMDQMLNGIPSVPKGNWNLVWEWRGDQLRFPGSLVITDLRIRYGAKLADFLDNTPLPGPWFQQQIPIPQALDMLANCICYEVAKARSDIQDLLPVFDNDFQAAAKLLVERDSVQPRSIFKVAEYGKMRDARTPLGPQSPRNESQ